MTTTTTGTTPNPAAGSPGAPPAGAPANSGTPDGGAPATPGTTLTTGAPAATKPDAAPPGGTTPAAAAPDPAKPGDKPGAAQPDGDKPADGIPEKYDIKLPDNSPLPAAVVERAAAKARELGLSNEKAQAYLTSLHEEVTTYHADLIQAHTQRVTGWVDELKVDKEYGGEKFVATANAAHRAFLKFGSPGLKEALDASGYGNHPEFVRMMARIGAALGEDTLELGNQGGKPAEKTPAQKMYPSMAKA
jgi:hypothetical protein